MSGWCFFFDRRCIWISTARDIAAKRCPIPSKQNAPLSILSDTGCRPFVDSPCGCEAAAESPMTSLLCLSLSVTGSDLLACSGRFLYSSVVIFAKIPASKSVMRTLLNVSR
ncbi:unnamed protein product [Chrysodeixis includens]|uniref:Uncharacterized protein n=1 Tax=Chrysodeixis includens TaxID=689277 RepID=A0A9N8PZU9_CHRIL|nr:unnamed protein product [Chrysodeixis includens]